jgi:hypothetical protein
LQVVAAVAATTRTLIFVAAVAVVLAVTAQVFLGRRLAVAVQPKAH